MSGPSADAQLLGDSLFLGSGQEDMWAPSSSAPLDQVQWSSPEPAVRMTMASLWPAIYPSLDSKLPFPSPPPPPSVSNSTNDDQTSKRRRVSVPSASDPGPTRMTVTSATVTSGDSGVAPPAPVSAKPLKDLHTFLKQITMRIRRLQTRPSLAQCRVISKWLSAVPTETQNPFVLEVAPCIVPRFRTAVDELTKALANIESLPVSLKYDTQSRTLSEVLCASSDVEIVQPVQQQQHQHVPSAPSRQAKREREEAGKEACEEADEAELLKQQMSVDV